MYSDEPFTPDQLQEIDETLQVGYSASQVAGQMGMSHGELIHRLIKSKRRVAYVNFLITFSPECEEIIIGERLKADAQMRSLASEAPPVSI